MGAATWVAAPIKARRNDLVAPTFALDLIHGSHHARAMSVLKTLRQTIAPELNFFYTVPPFQTPNGIDCGWFSREHALHVFFALRLSGVAVDLRSGDFAVLSRSVPPLTSLDTPNRHAWCSVAGTVPVDLSMTFALFGRGPQLKAPIIGEGANGDWQVRYARDEAVLDEKIQNENEIIFIERQVHAETEEDLLNDPYRFLPPPRIGDNASWHALYGPDIYAKISLHCFQCTTDAQRSVRTRFAPAQAVAWIAANYPAPEATIRALLKR
jgi:hypothetical protein